MHDADALRHIVENASDIIFTLNLDGTLRSVNRAAEQLFGITREQAFGRPIFEFIVPEDREIARDAMSQKLATGAATTYTVHVISSTGRVVPLEVSTQIFQHEGQAVAIQGIARDVSDRQAQFNALEQSERYFRTIIEYANDAFTVINADGTIRYQSPSAARILGFTPEERRGESVFALGHPQDVPIALELFETLRQDPHNPVTVTVRVRNKAGDYRHIEVRARNLVSDPAVGGYVLNWRDVTEQISATTLRSQREHFFRSLIERSSDILLVVDHDRIIRYVSPAFEALLGFKAEELLGTTGMQFIEPTEVDRVQRQIAELYEKKIPYASWEAHARDIHGNVHVFELRARNLIDDHIIGGLILNARDISESRRVEDALRESEQRFRKILETAAEGVSMRDASGRITFANERMAEIFGYPSSDEMIGLNVFDLIDPQDRDAFAASAERRKKTGRPEQMDLRFLRKDGTSMHILLSASPMFDVDGNYTGSLGMLTDLTERKQLEEQLRQSQKIEAVGRLAGGVAHDFNNLLTAIGGHVELLLDDVPIDTPWRHDVEEIRKAADRAAALTQQLLAFSRRQMLQPRVIELDDVVNEMESLLQRLIGEDIRLITHLRLDSTCVRADRSQIEQVLMNLAVNARDAMPHGGTLTVTTDLVDIDEEFVLANRGAVAGRYVRLCVRDTGEGMDQNTLSHLFEPFFTTKGLGKGTGLGLATVYGVVKQSGGYIRVESALKQGTEFEILLPAVAPELIDGREAAAASSSRGQGETVLVAEDEDAVRALACRILRKRGYDVLEAKNGEEALAVAHEHRGRIHLVLTDVVMPLLGGREMSERLTALRPDAKVLFMSGYTDDALLQRGVLQGGGHFLEKPFTPEGLAAKIREVLESD